MTPEEIYKELTKHFPKNKARGAVEGEAPSGFAGGGGDASPHNDKIEWVDGAKLPITAVQSGDPFIVVPPEKILEIAKVLKTREEFSFDCLSSLTAVDRIAQSRFEVVYHLFSYRHRQAVELKVYLERNEEAHLPTVEGVWRSANWLEREVFDLFGIKFDGHSDLRRIMLPDDWIGHPLRKDYKEQEDYHGIATTRPPLIQ